MARRRGGRRTRGTSRRRARSAASRSSSPGGEIRAFAHGLRSSVGRREVAHRGAQLGDGVAQAALRGLGADAGDLGDLLEREAGFLVEQEHVALFARQRLERGADARGGFLFLGASLGLPGLGRADRADAALVVRVVLVVAGRGGQARGGDRTHARAPAVIDEQVVREREQEGLEFRARFVALARADQAAPGFLEQVVGEFALARVAQQVAVQRALVARVERLEGPHLAGHPRLHQRRVVVPVPRHGLHCTRARGRRAGASAGS